MEVIFGVCFSILMFFAPNLTENHFWHKWFSCQNPMCFAANCFFEKNLVDSRK